MIQNSVVAISVAFPNYDPKDSLIESPVLEGVFARRPDLDRVFRLILDNPDKRDGLNDILKSYKEVYFSSNNGTAKPCTGPNDTYFNEQWALNNTLHLNADIRAIEAWNRTQGSENAVIAVIDHAIYWHDEFQGRIRGAHQYNEYDHSTFVAGIAAARGNNSTGIAGVTWNSIIYSTETDPEDQVSVYNSIEEAITTGGACVIVCPFADDNYSGLIHGACIIAHNLGVLVIASRGNREPGGESPALYPACYDDNSVMAVGGTNIYGNMSNFSMIGHGLDIMAPGGQNNTNHFDHIISTAKTSPYMYDWGTSASAPFVGGLVGLLYDYNQLPVCASNFRNIIYETAFDKGTLGYDEIYGHGLIDAKAALDYISRPRTVYTCTDNENPYIYNVTNRVQWAFTEIPGLGDGVYLAKQYEVRISFEAYDCMGHEAFLDPIIYWAVDELTTGWSGSNPNHGIRYCNLESVSPDGSCATLSTFVYELWTLDMDYVGFRPCQPSDVQFGASLIYVETPNPPRQLSVSASSDHHPKIQWYAPGNYLNVTEFNIYRKVHGIEPNWVHIGTVPHTVGTYHQYIDTEYSTPHIGPFAQWYDDADYTVVSVNSFGDESSMPANVTITVVVPERPEKPISKLNNIDVELLPDHYELSNAYPNPFNTSANIKYALPEDAFVTIEIWNLMGQKVVTLINERQTAGFKEINWNASGLSSGVYFCKLEANDFKASQQLTLLK